MLSTRPEGRRFKPTIRVTVVSIFIIATTLTAALAVGLQYHFSRKMATESALGRFDQLADHTGRFLNSADDRATDTVRVLASYPDLLDDGWVRGKVRDLFAAIMRDRNALYAVYVGFPNGDFFEVINLNSGEPVRRQLQAAPSDRWVMISVRGEGDARRKQLQYYDADFSLRAERTDPSDFNASKRPWFVKAQVGTVNKTEPYLFHNLQAPGQTYSTRTDSGAVVAVDIALSTISDYLSARDLQQFGEVFLFRGNGDLVASNRVSEQSAVLHAEPLKLSQRERELVATRQPLKISNETDWAPIDFSVSGQPRGYSVDYLSLIAQLTGLEFEYVNGYSWPELVSLYRSGELDILQPVLDDGSERYPGVYSDPMLSLSYSLVTRTGEPPIRHIRELQGKTLAIPAGWTTIKTLRREFPEVRIREVESTQAVFAAVKAGEADAGLDLGPILRFVGAAYYFSDMEYHDHIDFSPQSFPSQLHLVLSERRAALLPLVNRAIAGITPEQKAFLQTKWFSQRAQQERAHAVPYEALIGLAADASQHNRLVRVAMAGGSRYLFVTPVGHSGDYFGVVVPVSEVLRPALQKVQFSVLLTVGFLLLLIPAPWIFASPIVGPIKKLALENDKIRQRRYDELDIPDSYIREIHDLGESMGEMVEAIRAHEAAQVALMDAFIQIIATAIDDKSHYTAGHCERVPELAFMLAAKAEASRSPAFRDFSFTSEEQWREFRVGAWLHDCGKITTPEHIVDKGSKLETIYNRIHEVRTRFEVLWRDAEITYWKALSEDPSGQERYRRLLDDRQRQLQEDFAFVAAMNVGGEFLSENKKQRLQAIARQTWTRHFSDRLGLSPLEETRISQAEAALPCEENLLSDKPEHIIPREHDTEFDPALGIRMEIPEDLYNQGELYNLCIERGTLTAEDRFKINEHIISTIRMLDTLPFPPELAKVPRYASTHHETMKGTGYPRRLTGDQLSIPERIMVLADIFEALTAADRPYKKAKPVSVAIDILSKMVADEHIDVDVFELFLSSGVYRDYAQQFLPPEQLDEVDIDRYIRPAGA